MGYVRVDQRYFLTWVALSFGGAFTLVGLIGLCFTAAAGVTMKRRFAKRRRYKPAKVGTVVLEGEVLMQRLLSHLDERETYFLLLLVDFGTAVVSAKLIVHIVRLIWI